MARFFSRVQAHACSLAAPCFSIGSRSPVHLAARALSSRTRCALVARPTGVFATSVTRLCSAAAPSATEALTAKSFSRLAPMVLLQQALDQYAALDGSKVAREMDGEDVNRIIITRQTFDQFCVASHVSDTEGALKALSDAAVVVPLDDGQLVHLRPVRFAEEMDTIATLHTSGGADMAALENMSLPRSFVLHHQEQRVAELAAKEEALRAQLQPAVAKAARWRRGVWGGALVFAGAQLAIISRLTFFDLDWDIMEPVTYTITIGTALFFYLFYLRYDVEHTYAEFDRRYVTKRVRKYAPKDFDWEAYQTVCAQLDAERATLQALEAWANTH